MQAGVDHLVLDVMPIYMITPRESDSHTLYYQLLNSTLFTHHRILMLLREATSETYGPRVHSHHINLYQFIYLLCFYFTFTFYFASIYEKYQKYDLYQISLS